MKKFKIDVRDIDTGLAKIFDGHIEINMPNYKERLSLVKDLNFGEGDVENSIKMLELVERHVVGVDLEAGETIVKTFEDLGYSAEGVQLCNAIGRVLIKGVPLPGKSAPPSS